MVREAVILAAYGRETFGIDELVADGSVAASPGPAQGAGTVARGGHGLEREVADADLLAVSHGAVGRCDGEGRVHSRLRIVGEGDAARQRPCAFGRSDDLRAGGLRETRHSADMVEMLMAVEKDLHVGRIEAEAADVAKHDLGAGLGAAVDKDMAVIAGDEDRGDAAGPDEIAVAMDAEGRGGLVPFVPILALGGEARAFA